MVETPVSLSAAQSPPSLNGASIEANRAAGSDKAPEADHDSAEQATSQNPSEHQPNSSQSAGAGLKVNSQALANGSSSGPPHANESAPSVKSPVDQTMADTPISPSSKVSRAREDEALVPPASKRPKTEEDTDIGRTEAKPPQPPVSNGSTLSKLQHKFLVRCIQGLKRIHDSRFFKEPVDPVKLNIPTYFSIITHPMDMHTIEDKLKGGKYSSVDQVISDFDLMVNNAIIFNGHEHLVAIEGKNLHRSFQRHLSKLPGAEDVEPTAAEKKSRKGSSQPKGQSARRESKASTKANASSPTTFALGPEGLPVIRRDSTLADGRPKRSIHPPKNRDLPYHVKPKKKKFQWELKFCQETLDELHKTKHYNYAVPFYVPVDPVALNIPNYHNIIKKPMDLSTVQQKLRAGEYENAKEMEADMRLIFKNCYKFNIPGDPTYTAGQRLEEVFNNKWSQKTRWLETHEPANVRHSDSSDEGSEEEVDSEEDEETEKLTLLQKQIAEMSKQVEAITQKKKKTPPTNSKKSGKSKPGKKEKKPAVTGKTKKPGRTAKVEKVRTITYQEKQLISNGISALDERRMNEALRIIQSNVPALKNTSEAEIELDVDELPNDVLFLLLKFVKKHAPTSLMELEDYGEPEPDFVPNVASSKPKKNKPMNATEQEAQINRLESQLSEFRGGGGYSPEIGKFNLGVSNAVCGTDQRAVQSIETASTSDDDDSEESEEE